jgi:polyphosphate kinase
MPRNLDRRVEVTCPLYDPDLQQEMRIFLGQQLKDTIKTRILDRDLTNAFVRPEGGKESRAQWSTYEFLKGLSQTPRSGDGGPKDGGSKQSPEQAERRKGHGQDQG